MFPESFFHQPCARPTRALPSGRAVCCGSGACGLCPADSKFTVMNEMGGVFGDPRVTVRTGVHVGRVEITGDRADSVSYRGDDGREASARGELVVLGANALFNPHLMMRSGLTDAALGRGLVEQVGMEVFVDLDGLANFQGSTSITGHSYLFYAGRHRRERPAALVETWNVPRIRVERGKYAHRLQLKFIFEELRQDANRVMESASDPNRPTAAYLRHSDYVRRGLSEVRAMAERLVAGLPVERMHCAAAPLPTEGHIMGTTVMGTDPASSVVDADLVHHRVRNLVALGSGAFPTTSPANPTLTICALAMRSAERLLGA